MIAPMKFAFLLADLLALGPVAAPAAALPDGGEVAARIGQPVEFEDVIQAISFSRSRRGYYFSFGAPYPKQSLSVWVTEDLYEQLPRDPGLMGRRVRIRGQLENSPTGPMLSLASPDDFELLEVKDAMLSKSFLDGRMDRERSMAAVGQAFWREDFATLELLGQELQESRERFSDGTWILNAFFQALAVNRNESDARSPRPRKRSHAG